MDKRDGSSRVDHGKCLEGRVVGVECNGNGDRGGLVIGGIQGNRKRVVVKCTQ